MQKNFFKKSFPILLSIFFSLGFFSIAHADGNISSEYYTAQLCGSSGCVDSSTSTVNFGYFSTNSRYNATVRDTYLTGYIWGEGFGWAVLNCSDTTSGCTTSNGQFKVANDGRGYLSGYAWGEGSGWINFGPFSNSSTSAVRINSDGEFNGYAWAQNYGWIKFDCSTTGFCVKTSWRPSSSASGGGGGAYGKKITLEDVVPTLPVLPPSIIPTLPKLPVNPMTDTESQINDPNDEDQGFMEKFVPSIFKRQDNLDDSNGDSDVSPRDYSSRTNTQNESGSGFGGYVSEKLSVGLAPIKNTLNKVKLKTEKFLNTDAGSVLAKVAPATGLVFGISVSVAPSLFMNPITLAERAMIPGRLGRFFLLPVGKKKKRTDPFDKTPNHDDYNMFGPAHLISKGLDVLFKVLFFVGFVFAAMALWTMPSTANIVIALVYCVLFVVNIAVHRPKA